MNVSTTVDILRVDMGRTWVNFHPLPLKQSDKFNRRAWKRFTTGMVLVVFEENFLRDALDTWS